MKGSPQKDTESYSQIDYTIIRRLIKELYGLQVDDIITDMAESTPSIFERARERIRGPKEVKFSNGLRLIASIHNADPSIRLYRNKELLEDLKSYAPAETVIKVDPKGRWAAEIGSSSSKPILTIGKFKGVDAILDFLHECGHLQDPVSTDLALTARNQYAQKFFRESSDNIDPARFAALHERDQAVQKSERNAWAFAIRITRQLDQKYGLDIIKRIGGIDGIFKYVNSYLGRYEQQTITELEYLGFEVYSKAQMEETLRDWMKQ